MTCLGGTQSNPKRWMRFKGGFPADKNGEAFRHGEPIMLEGRVPDCNNPADRTRPKVCKDCPAYRGERPDGGAADALARDGWTVMSLTELEWDQYLELDGEQDDPDSHPFRDWLRAQEVKRSEERTPEDRRAYKRAYMRDYRANCAGLVEVRYEEGRRQDPRRKAYKREYMREYMRERRAKAKVQKDG